MLSVKRMAIKCKLWNDGAAYAAPSFRGLSNLSAYIIFNIPQTQDEYYIFLLIGIIAYAEIFFHMPLPEALQATLFLKN